MSQNTTTHEADVPHIPKIFIEFGEKYKVNPCTVGALLRRTAFRQLNEATISNAEMVALLVTAMSCGLNPFAGEIYAVQAKDGRIIPVVGVDGWSRIINSQSQLDGMGFAYSNKKLQINASAQNCPEWVECSIYKKDCQRPVVVREYLTENYIDAEHWNSKTVRQLRHKSMVQCARYAFGLPGIPEHDDLYFIERPTGKPVEATKPLGAPTLGMGGLEQAKKDCAQDGAAVAGKITPVIAARAELAAGDQERLFVVEEAIPA